MNPKVDWFFNKAGRWKAEFAKLREIVLDCDLVEELKWGQPCYQFEKKNIVVIHGFKEYCALLFFKGALMKDPKGVLIQQTANVQSARQIRFKNLAEITKLERVLKKYIYEAITVQEKGLKVDLKTTREFPMPEELRKRLERDKPLKKAFEALTPGRKRGYLLYISSAKQASTREARIDKYRKKILEGKSKDD